LIARLRAPYQLPHSCRKTRKSRISKQKNQKRKNPEKEDSITPSLPSLHHSIPSTPSRREVESLFPRAGLRGGGWDAAASIIRGAAFQIVLAQRFRGLFYPPAVFDLYRALALGSTPRLYVLSGSLGSVKIIGTSAGDPGDSGAENGAGCARSPHAPCGKTRRRTWSLEKELLADEKERAEAYHAGGSGPQTTSGGPWCGIRSVR